MENESRDSNNITSSDVIFDNLIIVKEFTNIANLIGNEDFLDAVPKAKLGRIYWVTILNCLKQEILDEIVQEMNSMWSFENMNQKLEILEKQKEKFDEINPHKSAWRPQHSNLGNQLRASDAASLMKQKAVLEPLSKEYDVKVNRLKKIVRAKRTFLIAMQMDIQKYQKKNEEIRTKIKGRIEAHGKVIENIVPNFDNSNWSINDDFQG